MNRLDTSDPASEPAPRGPELAAMPRRYGVRTMVTTYASGFLMGSADVVPGVSGGTVALVVGIYDRLVANVRQGAAALSLGLRADLRRSWTALRRVEWTFLLPLLAGIATAVLVLASWLEHLLETQPVLLAAAFCGLVAGSIVVAFTEVERRTAAVYGAVVVTAVAVFALLGLRSGRFTDPGLAVLFGGGAVAATAMILPGISGSFILLMLGLYDAVLGAVSDRDVVTVAVFAAGAGVGLGAFSTLLNWLLVRARDLVLGVLIGLMLGSFRVLWPWPAGSDGVGDTALGAPVGADVPVAIALAVGGAVAVVVIAVIARALSEADT